MRRTLIFAPTAVTQLRRIDRQFVRSVWAVIDALAENPANVQFETDPDDPSVCKVILSGDIVVSFEILDEKHAIRVLEIDDE